MKKLRSRQIALKTLNWCTMVSEVIYDLVIDSWSFDGEKNSIKVFDEIHALMILMLIHGQSNIGDNFQPSNSCSQYENYNKS